MGDPRQVVLVTYTIYQSDDGFRAVEFEVDRGGDCRPVREMGHGATLDQVRGLLAQLAPWADACVTRSPGDAPDIVETWL